MGLVKRLRHRGREEIWQQNTVTDQGQPQKLWPLGKLYTWWQLEEAGCAFSGSRWVLWTNVAMCRARVRGRQRPMLLNNNQYQGFIKQRALFGVLGIAIQETQIWVKPKECCKEEKVRGL